MTLDDLRALIAHHQAEAAIQESYADMSAQLFNDQAAADRFRLRAEWHHSTAVHLSELADAFALFGEQLASFTSGPNTAAAAAAMAPDKSSINKTTTTPAEKELAAPHARDGAGAGA